jgi:hypothetical protein
MTMITPDLAPSQLLMRPLDMGDIRLGQQLIDFLATHVSYDGDAEAAIGAMVGIYAKHRLQMGDETAISRLAQLADVVCRHIGFRSITDVLNAEGGVAALNEALKAKP